MKQLLITAILLISINSYCQLYINIPAGISKLSSNFTGRYEPSISYGISTGYKSDLPVLNYMADLTLEKNNFRIKELNRNLSISQVKLTGLLLYKFLEKYEAGIGGGMGIFIQNSIRISRPYYNYDFDTFDYFMSAYVLRNIIGKEIYKVNIGIKYTRSLDNIIVDNFWEDDALLINTLQLSVMVVFK